jgi:hypothetical protein
MGYTGLTSTGKQYIRNAINSSSCLSGRKNMPGVDFTKYITVYGKDPASADFTWQSNIVTSNSAYIELLIASYNKYAQTYSMNANVLAAQGFCESRYKVWDFSIGHYVKSGKSYPAAMGLAQFIRETFQGILDVNEYHGITPVFTQAEKDMMYKNTSSDEYNKAIILQNMMDHPELMIKAQSMYMKFCANLAKGLASSALFGYNRGHSFIDPISYTNTVLKCVNKYKNTKKSDYYKEGVTYVWRVFSVLGDPGTETGFKKGVEGYFGYDFLGMNAIPSVKAKEFGDGFTANTKNIID